MSIRLRFTLALTGVGVVLFGTYAALSYRSERDDLRTAAIAEIRIEGQSLETSLGNAIRDNHPADIDETLAALEDLAPNLDIHVRDAAGTPIAQSRGARLDGTVERLAARAGATRTETIAFDPADDPTRLIFSGPLTADDGAVIGSVTIARPIDDLLADLERTRDRLLLAVAALLVATMATGLVLGTLLVTLPLEHLLAGVRQRAHVAKIRRDEVGELVDEFNAMIDALAAEGEARSQLEHGLQRVDKLVTIGQLSAGLAHEIGSPLQVLSGRAETLCEHDDPEVQRQGGLLIAQCDRITKVVEQLLSFGRRKPAARGACDLARPVRAVIDLLGAEAKRHRVTLELAIERRATLLGDPDQIQQVALNLVRNALSVTPAGGRISVRIDGGRLIVRDTGPGIAPEVKARLFEPFFTTRASDGGTGLGLAVVRAIADDHHATIDVRSDEHGAEFCVAFPEGTV